MKYYKDLSTGEVFAYESEEERQEWGSPELVEITEQEMRELAAQPDDDAQLNSRTFKTDVWQRTTEDEAEIIDGALITSPVRMRRMWDDCQVIEHESELFADLYAAMVDAFGEERADELLAPSEGA